MASQDRTRDWEQDLSKLIGDPLAFQVGYRVREFKDQTRQLKQDAQQMLTEYVRYELDLVPSPLDLTRFNHAITQLESDTDALEARLIRLTQSS